MHKRRLATGFITLFAAWLLLGQAALVYAVPGDPVTPSTAPTTTAPAAPTPDLSATGGPTLPGNASANPSDFIKPTCTGAELGWIVCPLVNMSVEAISKISNIVIKMLEVKPLVETHGLYDIWLVMRDLADVMFVIIFLVLIYSTLASTANNSYQLKSLLPKLIAAAILVQFSFVITAFIIDLGNVLGSGIGTIISQLGTNGGNANDVTHGINNIGAVIEIGMASIAAIIAGVILTLPIILMLLASFLLSLLAVFATLAFRQLIIAALVVTSPLAFAAWVLPNTQEAFKQWIVNLFRIIMVYPMIVILLALGGFLARVATVSDGVFGTHELNIIFASIIPILVFAAIPTTFKLAGSALGKVTGSVYTRHDRGKGWLRGSQMAQDIRASRKEKGFIAQRDAKGWNIPGASEPSFGKLQRRVGRYRAGQFGWGKPTTRRLVTGYDAALGAQMKDWGSVYDDQGFGNKDLYDKIITPGLGGTLSYVTPDGKTKKYTVTKAMQAQAVAQIAKQGGNLELNDINRMIFDPTQKNYKGDWHDSLNMPKKEVIDMWFRGLGASGAMPQVIQANPIVNPGKLASVYDGLSGSQVSKIHGSGWDFYYNRIMADVQPSATEIAAGLDVGKLKQARVNRAVASFIQIANSPQLRADVDLLLLQKFKDRAANDADFRRLLSNYSQKHGSNGVISGADFFDRFVSDEGKIIE